MPDYPALIIGLGNAMRCDDAAGLLTAKYLREMNLPDVKIIEGVSDGTTLMETWTGSTLTVLIDSVFAKGKAGKIFRFDALHEPIPEDYFVGYSTHAFSIVETIELARALDTLPDRLIVYGIEGQCFDPGENMTAEVYEAVSKVVAMIQEELNERE